LKVIGQRFSGWRRFAGVIALSATLFSVAGCQSMADLVPGHREAELKRRVDADKDFPTADQALNPSLAGDGSRTRSAN
jgi:hypothetical protein